MTDDPFAVLGVPGSATLDELRAARRRLALALHPDRHPGSADPTAMQRVNAAFDLAVGHVTGRRPIPGHAPPGHAPSGPSPAATPGASAQHEPAPRAGGRRRPRVPPPRRFRGIEHDTPSFTIDALPAEAFEALLVVCSWIGELIDDDPPYVLECVLVEPAPCWCRLELVPDAGGSTVSLTVASAAEPGPGGELPGMVSAEAVRDVWVEHLNRLGRQQP